MAHEQKKVSPTVVVNLTWTAPPKGYYKCNLTVSLLSNGYFGMGMLIRNYVMLEK